MIYTDPSGNVRSKFAMISSKEHPCVLPHHFSEFFREFVIAADEYRGHAFGGPDQYCSENQYQEASRSPRLAVDCAHRLSGEEQ